MNSDKNGYNGWSNRETWCVSLWLANDEKTYYAVRELATEAKDSYAAAQAIREYVEEFHPLAHEANLFSDLLSAALASIDWLEVAESILNE